MDHRDFVALSDALIDAAGAAGKPSVLIAQYDINRDERLFRWSCDDRSIGFRLDTWPVSELGLQELVRTWREAPHAPGSTMETAEKSRQMEGVVIRANMP